jgi:hypothetical protein
MHVGGTSALHPNEMLGCQYTIHFSSPLARWIALRKCMDVVGFEGTGVGFLFRVLSLWLTKIQDPTLYIMFLPILEYEGSCCGLWANSQIV